MTVAVLTSALTLLLHSVRCREGTRHRHCSTRHRPVCRSATRRSGQTARHCWHGQCTALSHSVIHCVSAAMSFATGAVPITVLLVCSALHCSCTLDLASAHCLAWLGSHHLPSASSGKGGVRLCHCRDGPGSPSPLPPSTTGAPTGTGNPHFPWPAAAAL